MTEIPNTVFGDTKAKTPSEVTLPSNMVAAAGWVLYKFATEPQTEHLKNLALFLATEMGKKITGDQDEMDKLISSYMDENSK